MKKTIFLFFIIMFFISCAFAPDQVHGEKYQEKKKNVVFVADNNFEGHRKETVGDTTGDWTCLTKNAQFSARESSQIFIIANNKFWLIGGHNTEYLNDIWRSDDGQIWYREKDITPDYDPWCGRRSHAVIYYNSKFWVIGGCVASGKFGRDVWSSTDGISWSLVTTTPAFGRRAGHGLVEFDGKMYLVGGYVSNEDGSSWWDSDDVFYSTDGITWTLATNNPGWAGRRNHGCIVYDGKIWIIGGLKNSGETFILCDDAWYSSNGINWTQASSNAIYTRARMGLAVVNSKLYMVGGLVQNPAQWNLADSSENNVSNDVYEYDGSSWTQLSDIPWAKRASLSCVEKDGKLIIMAGSQSFINAWFNDVWRYEGN